MMMMGIVRTGNVSERAAGGRPLSELSGTDLGVLREEHSATLERMVGEVDIYALIRVVPLGFRFLMGRKPSGLLLQRERGETMADNKLAGASHGGSKRLQELQKTLRSQ